MGELKYIDASGYIAGYLQALKENNITPDFEKLALLALNRIEENSDNDYALGRIKGIIEDEISSNNDEQNKTSEKKIYLNAISILLNSDDMRLGQVIYDLEENIAFGQEEIDCTDIPECYEDMLPDDVDEDEKKDWFWDYVDEHPERFISVNIDYDGYDTMVGFIRTIDDIKLSNKLASAIRGKGAFRRFRYVVEENGLLQKWYDFKNAAEENAIREWCKDNGYKCVASKTLGIPAPVINQ